MKIAVIGLGYWGPNLLRNFLAISELEVLGCEKDRKRLEKIKEMLPSASYITDYNALLNDNDLKAVAIATPVGSHYSLTKEFLENGKDVFVEKPMTKSSREAKELIKIAEEQNAILMVGHIFEYNDAVLKIGELIKGGEIGDVQYITSTRVNLGIHRKDANVLWDLAPHDFSILFNWLDSDPVSIATTAKESIVNGIPDVAFIQATFPSGMIADIQVGWLAPSKIRETVVVGSKKMIVYDETNPQEKIKVYDSGVEIEDPHDYGEFLLSYRSGAIHSPTISTREPLRTEMNHFVECIRERKKPRTDGFNALRVIKAVEMAEESRMKKKMITI